MRILVTGAAGNLGVGLVAELHEAGHDVVATDSDYRPGLAVPLHLADLTDPQGLPPLLDGCDALIHGGNHPHKWAVRPNRRVLTENLTMNGLTLNAARELGVRRVVFVSSIQAVSGDNSHRRDPEPHGVPPRLPLDGDLPADPGLNPYAQSKALTEQMLHFWSGQDPEAALANVRLPFIYRASHRWSGHMRSDLGSNDHRLGEALTYLPLSDAQSFLRACVERMGPGLRTYFPAVSMRIEGMTPSEAAARFLPGVPIDRPLDPLGGWVDRTAIERDLNWTPAAEPMSIGVKDRDPAESAAG
jgi:hypothetical protein